MIPAPAARLSTAHAACYFAWTGAVMADPSDNPSPDSNAPPPPPASPEPSAPPEAPEPQPTARASRPPIEPAGNFPPPPPPGPSGAGFGGGMIYPPPPPPQRRGGSVLGRVFSGILVLLLSGSVILNLYLLVLFFMLAGRGPTEAEYMDGDSRLRIVILPIEGLIDDATAEFVRSSLHELRDNPPKALVLRVDSGGGYVSPSDQIWNELKLFKEETKIPLVASFGSTAASGGYYVSASADAIVAEPTCVTGSIGVIAQAFTFPELMSKVGVTPEVITSTDSTRKDTLSPFRTWTEADRGELRSMLDHAYERFVKVVHEGRSPVVQLDLDDVRALATGEVFTVTEALANKLVDHEGYIRDAVRIAKDKAGIAAADEPEVTWMGRPESFGLGIFGSSAAPKLSDIKGEQLRGWMLELSAPMLLYGGAGAGR